MYSQAKAFFTAMAMLAAIAVAAPQKGTMTDSRDGKTYKTVKIGKQVWMAENLNYESENSFCYDDDAANCTKYGRLYTWAAAMDSVGKWSANGKGCGGYDKKCSPTYPVRGVCPEGWHLPSKAEFKILFESVGGKNVAGKMLKSRSGWKDDGNGTDTFGFSALPAGDGKMYDFVRFGNVGHAACFWSSTEYETDYSSGAFDMCLVGTTKPWDILEKWKKPAKKAAPAKYSPAKYDIEDSGSVGFWYKNHFFSVRCVKDLTESRTQSYSNEINQESFDKYNETAIETQQNPTGTSAKANRSDLSIESKFQQLSNQRVNKSDLSNYSKADLRILRNSIFARYGLMFKSEDLKTYFSKFEWYQPQHPNVDAMLNEIERKNVKIIKEVEKTK